MNEYKKRRIGDFLYNCPLHYPAGNVVSRSQKIKIKIKIKTRHKAEAFMNGERRPRVGLFDRTRAYINRPFLFCFEQDMDPTAARKSCRFSKVAQPVTAVHERPPAVSFHVGKFYWTRSGIILFRRGGAHSLSTALASYHCQQQRLHFHPT